MQYMGIVECVSSGRLYVDDIISHGYRPLIINTKVRTEHLLSYRKMAAKDLGDKVEFIDEDEDFDVFLEELRRYDLKAVFPGSERGVRLAERISTALGLRGNDSSTTDLRATKEGMYKALGDAGLRRIESRVVTCEGDIRAFWDERGSGRCVVKFSEVAGSVGLKICSSPEEATEHYRQMLGMSGTTGVQSRILIQEYIGGTEYIVNTLSCDGKHMVTDVWEYTKVLTDDGAMIYDYSKLLKDIGPGLLEMIQYAYDVLDAVQMRWGLCHTEIKIDDAGPVLIETNARLMGLGMTRRYLDEILGHHQTDLAVDVFLEPSIFTRLARRPYDPPKYALMKSMVVPEDMIGSFSPAFLLSNMVPSTREVLFFGKEGFSEYRRTVDLDTSPMAIKMANSDYGELMKDYEMLRTVEKNYFRLFYTFGEELEAQERTTDIQHILDSMDRNMKMLVVTDDGTYAWQYGRRMDAGDPDVYDGAIFAQCGRCRCEDRYRSIFRTIRDIRSGGIFIAVPESRRSMKYGGVAMDFVMNIGGVHILLPAYEANGLVYGIKR